MVEITILSAVGASHSGPDLRFSDELRRVKGSAATCPSVFVLTLFRFPSIFYGFAWDAVFLSGMEAGEVSGKSGPGSFMFSRSMLRRSGVGGGLLSFLPRTHCARR